MFVRSVKPSTIYKGAKSYETVEGPNTYTRIQCSNKVTQRLQLAITMPKGKKG